MEHETKTKLERVMNDLKPIIESEGSRIAQISRENLLAQRPYELSSSPDYTDWG